MSIEIINKEGDWVLRKGDQEQACASREDAVRLATEEGEPNAPVIHERSVEMEIDASLSGDK